MVRLVEKPQEAGGCDSPSFRSEKLLGWRQFSATGWSICQSKSRFHVVFVTPIPFARLNKAISTVSDRSAGDQAFVIVRLVLLQKRFELSEFFRIL